jgi:hypothetical protein
MSLHRERTHFDFVEGCFGCKASTIDLNAGEASSRLTMSAKKWDNELALYRTARSQGIQPAGTSMKQIQEAHRASEVLNQPYNANVMPSTKDINSKSVEALKHVGVI